MNSRNATINISMSSYNVTFIAYNCTRKSDGAYAIFVALGFSLIENMLYLLQKREH